jgi:hypothetical protein
MYEKLYILLVEEAMKFPEGRTLSGPARGAIRYGRLRNKLLKTGRYEEAAPVYQKFRRALFAVQEDPKRTEARRYRPKKVKS